MLQSHIHVARRQEENLSLESFTLAFSYLTGVFFDKHRMFPSLSRIILISLHLF